jgi:hypothetical protein
LVVDKRITQYPTIYHVISVKFSSSSDERYGQSVATSRSLLNSAVLDVSETGTAVLFNRMKDDNLKMIVMHDTLIKKYASLRLESLGTLATPAHSIAHAQPVPRPDCLLFRVFRGCRFSPHLHQCGKRLLRFVSRAVCL